MVHDVLPTSISRNNHLTGGQNADTKQQEHAGQKTAITHHESVATPQMHMIAASKLRHHHPAAQLGLLVLMLLSTERLRCRLPLRQLLLSQQPCQALTIQQLMLH
jgi:hypothetical protein